MELNLDRSPLILEYMLDVLNVEPLLLLLLLLLIFLSYETLPKLNTFLTGDPKLFVLTLI